MAQKDLYLSLEVSNFISIMNHFTSLFVSLCTILLASGCSDRNATDDSVRAIHIAPSILTRVSGLYFEPNDCIGLTIVQSTGNYVDNCMMTYDGSTFVGENLVWYDASEGSATFMACYPYSPEGLVDRFSVAGDQRSGCETSDLLGAVKKDVVPASAAVHMVFYHLMTQLDILVNNNTSATVTEVVVSGFVPAATVDLSVPTAAAASDGEPADVTAYEVTPGEAYRVILVPQQAAMTVTIRTDDGEARTKSISSAQLESGRRYNLSVVLDKERVELALSGEIGDWVDGGSLGEDSGDTGSDPDIPDTGGSTLEYAGETYTTTVIDGVTWMAENLRYLPEGAALGENVWEPGTGTTQSGNLGLLYTYATAMNGTTSTDGGRVQGICPSGWHIPSRAELETLMSSVTPDFVSDAGYCGETGYWLETTSMLMSSELDATSSDTCYVLKKKDGKLSISSVWVGCGFSLRCVKD